MDRLFDTSIGDLVRVPMVNLYRTAVANTNPAALGADVVMAAFSVPAYYFNAPNKGLDIYVQGNATNSANAKRAKIFIGATSAVVGSAISGGTAIADTASFTTVGGGLIMSASVYKYGANGSNTQIGLHTSSQVGGTVQALIASTALTLTENAPIIVAVTMNVATTATDISFNLLEIDGMMV